MRGKNDLKAKALLAAELLVVLGALAFILYITQNPAAQNQSTRTDLQTAYAEAVADAKYATTGEIYHNLTSITPGNAGLMWKDNRALFVTWTSYTGYDNLTGQETNLSREVWASVDNEIKDFCTSVPGQNLTLRLEQKLGLPPGSGKTRFVEIYASPSDIFRPCPDPEITDSECGLDYPENVSAEHVLWFEDKNVTSYLGTGYPWTRLGYTYDWGSSNHVGMSEFVIRGGAEVMIYNVSSTSQFCG
ncbi:MAG: hypothetical protein PHS02_04430 [Candidatus ainarchaeum sp.]|nr:hypothetical protein [Candidatus ainarchaeum sp.]